MSRDANDPRRANYEPPAIVTYTARAILELLGPAVANYDIRPT